MDCSNCKNYSPLAKPREFKQGHIIYGYCFKDNGFNDKGYPVYIPEGVCKHLIPYTKKPSGLDDFRKSEQKAQRFRRNKVDCENQMSINDFMEVIEE